MRAKARISDSPAVTLRRVHLPITENSEPNSPSEDLNSVPVMMDIPLNKAAARQPCAPLIIPSFHVNILIASMTVGGAERIVHDILTGLESRRPTGKLFIMHDLVPSYPLESVEGFPVIRLGRLERSARIPTVALEVLTSPSSVLYTHLIRATDLSVLWDYGVTTIPVIHNSAPGWQDPPDAYEHDRVPFFIAASEDVRRQLIAAGCRKPVVVLRHELQRWRTAEEVERDRAEIRQRHGIRADTLLIGMVGQFKAHKAYPRAARILYEVCKFAKAKLMILGGWDHDYGAGRVTYTATIKLALEAGVLPDLMVLGSVFPVEPYYAAFDIFLNTSIYEGMSVATLEAAQCGCPIVSADVGGQREAVPIGSALISDCSDIGAYVAAIRDIVCTQRHRVVALPPPALDLIPRLWCMISRYGVHLAAENGRAELADTLFVTSNLNPGGAQRSLTNLLTHIVRQHRAWLCVLGHVLGDHFIGKLESADVTVIGICSSRAQLDRIEQLLELIERLGVRTVCFWNVEAPLKLLVTKVLAQREIRLVDVSPGPMLFSELDDVLDFQRRIAFSAAEYLSRIDCFVAKYRGGEPPERYGVRPRRVEVISNGVTLPELASPGAARVRPDSVDPSFAIVSCCRIVPNKRIEWLVEMMRLLTLKVPKTSLTIVGGVDQRHIGYWESVCAEVRKAGLQNIHFAGPNADVFSFLSEFKVFVMISNVQGCPNASLEAMAAGLPVVANANGGTAEQVVHAHTGYLVSGTDPGEMANRVASLLRTPERAQRFGLAGRRRAERLFSTKAMVRRYLRILHIKDRMTRPET
jgi:glycosyltransferase involved in cell wall biosynthesis